MLRLVEYIYMMRHERDLRNEDAGMRILVEILRQPELFTKICGSYLKGDQDPAYDDYVDMTKQVKQKRTKTKKITDEQVLQFQLNFNAL
jgi:hypothetical protein